MRASSVALLLPSVLGFVVPIQKRGTPVSLPITARYGASKLSNIAEVDLARVRSMIENAKEGASGLNSREPVPLKNAAVSYTISAGVGFPPTIYNLVVDTGSSNTWVGASPNKPYVRTSTSVDTGNSVQVLYGSGFFTSDFDTLNLTQTLIFTQSIGAASSSGGFENLDGVLGIGPTGLTTGTVNNTDTIPTIVDTLYNQGLINNDLIGVYFKPVIENDTSTGNGKLDLGDIDKDKMIQSVTFVPITSTPPSNTFWGVNLSIRQDYLDSQLLPPAAGIVDTGTTLVLLTSDAFQKYQQATGSVFDSSTGLLRVTRDQFLKLPSLFIKFGDEALEFTTDAQAWPTQLNTAIGGTSDNIYLIVGDLGTSSDEGFEFILGQTFLYKYSPNR
ncbi:hypothetical protein Clacol_010291 [Clathrus columnatus]|uniref:Peptidase A1 domain-containing protein n=1 Tax=Clathrus columnatus TaxID=1419009 RepID=A0AAV5AQB9_9AGAM|nr:hypothetical protein Clacol_010291 [Clathrus columnatus]